MQSLSQHPSTEIAVSAHCHHITSSSMLRFLQPYPQLLNWTAVLQKKTRRRFIIKLPLFSFWFLRYRGQIQLKVPLISTVSWSICVCKAERGKVLITVIWLNTKQIQKPFTTQRIFLVTCKYPEPSHSFRSTAFVVTTKPKTNQRIPNKDVFSSTTHFFPWTTHSSILQMQTVNIILEAEPISPKNRRASLGQIQCLFTPISCLLQGKAHQKTEHAGRHHVVLSQMQTTCSFESEV